MTSITAPMSPARQRLHGIIERRSVLRDGPYTLASGKISDHFLDIKRTIFNPEGISALADAVLEITRDSGAEAIGGLELGAPLIAVAISARSCEVGQPIAAFAVRKQVKDHGTKKSIEGDLKPGMKVIVIDDVMTTAGSTLQAVRAVREAGCEIVKAICIVDRLEGARENLDAEGVPLEPLFTWNDFK